MHIMKLYKSLATSIITALCLSSAVTAFAGDNIIKDQNSPKASVVTEIQENKADITPVVYKNPHSGKIEISGSIAAEDCIIKGASKEAQAAYDKARANEQAISRDMIFIAEKLGLYLHGIPFSVKTASSVADKIERVTEEDAKKGVKRTDEQIVNGFKDLVRYTLVSNHDDIAKNSKKAMHILKKRNYNVFALTNTYNDKSTTYRGLHLFVIDKNKQKFEVQMHSEESIKRWEVSHLLYEEARQVSCEPNRRAQLNAKMKEIYAGLPMPKGIEHIKTYAKPIS